jgi:hypothetical protein
MATAMDLYAPFDAGPGGNVTEDMWRRFMKRPTVSGVLRNVGNEMAVYADSTGMQARIPTGEVWIEGHWGSITTEKIQPIVGAHATLARVDRVVARCDFVANRIEYDVLTGTPAATPVALGVTRNASIYEVSLATVSVGAGVLTIAATAVTDARQFGGPPYSAVTDDQLFYGDKLATCRRNDCTNSASLVDGQTYVERVVSQVENVVSEFRVFSTAAQVGGTAAWAIYTGYTQRDFTQLATGSIVLTGTTDVVKVATFAPIAIQAGTQCLLAIRTNGATTAAQLAAMPTLVSSNFTNPVNPVPVRNNVYKASTPLPTTVDLLDGTWTSSALFRWMALK